MLETDDPHEKMAASYAVAQSVKLSVYEARVLATINRTKHIPQVLAETGRIGLSQKSISKQMGQLFIEVGGPAGGCAGAHRPHAPRRRHASGSSSTCTLTC